MIDLYYWTTPNGHKITMYLEETGVEYRILPVNIARGEQFEREFLELSPNNRIPAIVDHCPEVGNQPISVFESGAILLYLAKKRDGLLPEDPVRRIKMVEWLVWQVANLGPMLGQNHHFLTYSSEKLPYAIKRYLDETARLYAVLDRHLEGREYIVEEYSIADIACYPWIVPHERQQQDLDRFPNVRRWFDAIQKRPATARAYARGLEINSQGTMSEEAKKVLFGQTDAVVRDRGRLKRE